MIKKLFKIIISFSLIITIYIITGCATKSAVDKKSAADKEDKLIEKVTVEAESGNMDKALKIYESGNGKDPLLRSILLIKNGKLDEAESILSEIIEKDNSNITALYYSSLIYNLRGDKASEKKIVEKIVTLDPDNVDANIALGRIYTEEKSYKKAESCFKKVISSNNYIEEAVLGYGVVLLAQKKNDEALAQFNIVIKNNPDNMIAYVQRAQIKSVNDDFKGAETDLDEAIRINPDYIWNYLDRGRARLYGGKYGFAAQDFTKVLLYDDSIFVAYIHRAQANERMKKDDLALADYKKAMELRSDYKRGFVPYALQLYRSGQWDDAAVYFIKAYNIDKSPEYLLLSAASLMHAGEKQMANKLITDNMNRIPKENLLYHVSRLYIDPLYETIVINKLKEETESFERMKGMFYIAVYYDTYGKNMLSEKYYTEIINSGFPETLEYRIASWKVQ